MRSLWEEGRGDGLWEALTERLSQPCSTGVLFYLRITSYKTEKLHLLLLIRKLREGSDLLEIEQVQSPELGLDPWRTGAAHLAQGLNPPGTQMC